MKEQKTQFQSSLSINIEEQRLNSQQKLENVLATINQLKQSLEQLRQNGLSALPDTRSLKIIPRSRESYSNPFNIIPEITLRGNWLQKAGFEYEQRIRVITMHELLIICPEEMSQA